MIEDPPVDFVERPISAEGQDRLSRAGFVSKIVDALISPQTYKSRGVVLGITGPWGSGKSSVLNLIAEDAKRRFPDAVVVRFDPWLISGHLDLISAFLKELVATLSNQPKGVKKFKDVISGISDYSSSISPALDLVHPGVGAIFRGASSGLSKISKGDASIDGLKKKLGERLSSLDCAIIVLIDELDRVEDHEVRAVAQLVRSVADFPGISYVLAYDPVRVAQALSDSQDTARGRAYLEKIVQLPIALPITLPGELRDLMDTEVANISKDLGLKAPLNREPRYSLIAEALVPDLISTPRDVKRLVASFAPLANMVSNEVDLIDVFGFSALVVKAPATVQFIRNDPERWVVDPLAFTEHARRLDRAGGRARDYLNDLVSEEDLKARKLVLRLFYEASGDRPSEELHSNSISRRRGLLTLLRLGLLPGDVSQSEAEQLLTSDEVRTTELFEAALANDTIGSLLDRIVDTYPSRVSAGDFGFWSGAANFLNSVDDATSERIDRLETIRKTLCDVLVETVEVRPDERLKAARIMEELKKRGDLAMFPALLHKHFFVFGIFGARADGGQGWFLTAQETSNWSNNSGQVWNSILKNGNLIPKLLNAYPLYIMLRTGNWDADCRQYLQDTLSRHVIRLAEVLFPPGSRSDRDMIDKLCGHNEFVSAVEIRLKDDELSPSTRGVLEKALSDPF